MNLILRAKLFLPIIAALLGATLLAITPCTSFGAPAAGKAQTVNDPTYGGLLGPEQNVTGFAFRLPATFVHAMKPTTNLGRGITIYAYAFAGEADQNGRSAVIAITVLVATSGAPAYSNLIESVNAATNGMLHDDPKTKLDTPIVADLNGMKVERVQFSKTNTVGQIRCPTHGMLYGYLGKRAVIVLMAIEPTSLATSNLPIMEVAMRSVREVAR